MKSLVWFLALFLMSGLAQAEEQREGDYVPDPVSMRSNALGQMFRSSPLPQRFKLGEVGEWRFNASRTYVNFWGHDKRYIVDTEMKDDQFSFYYQPLPTFEFYGSFTDRGFSRSSTDGMAIGFHHIFGLAQDGRLDAKRGAIRISVPDYNLNITAANKNNSLSRQVEAGGVWDLAQAYALHFPMTLSLSATHETARGNPYFTGATDYSSRLSLSLPLGNTSIYGSISFATFDTTEEIPIATKHQQWGTIFGVAQRLASNHELFTQFVVYQPLFEDMGQLSRTSYEIHLAYRYKWDQVSFEIGLIENVFWVYNTPDWGYTAGLTWHSKK